MAEKSCIGTEPHGAHDWHGFPPDVWRCPGVRVRLTQDEVDLLGEAFGGSTPSPLLTRRVEQIIAARLRLRVGVSATKPEAAGLTDVLASHRFSITKAVDGTDNWGWCAGGDSWHTQTRAEHEAHVAAEVSRWLRTALLGDEVVEAAGLVFGWQHLVKYSGQTEEWMNQVLAAILTAALDRVEALSTKEADT